MIVQRINYSFRTFVGAGVLEEHNFALLEVKTGLLCEKEVGA
jgi:hypothetical protein